MDRMSPLDAAFLDAEDEDRHTSMAISSIAVFEGPAPDYDDFVAAIGARLPLVPRYRQKVRQVPFDLARPVWVDDPHFELRYHIRQTALPAPGGDVQLARLMERVMASRLDRERPLWEYWLVEGLHQGRWALISKLHHCMVDGVSGTDLYRVLLDTGPEPSVPVIEDRWQPASEPSTLRLTAQAVRDLALSPLEQVRALRGALRRPRQLAQQSADTVRGLARLSGALVPSTASSLSGPIGQQRRYRWARTSFTEIAAVRHQLGGTMNDVVLAVITGAFRELLCSRGEQPGRHVIRSLVPVSTRGRGEEGIYDNRVSLMLATLPVDVADPVARLAAVRTHLASLKTSREAEAGEALTSLARYEPFPLISLGIRLAFRIPQRNIITVTTNVPGPRRPLYAMGRPVVEMLPYVPIAARVRYGLSIFTYCDKVTFGITGDRDSSADIDLFARGIESSMRELVQAAEAARPARPGGPARAAEPAPTGQPVLGGAASATRRAPPPRRSTVRPTKLSARRALPH